MVGLYLATGQFRRVDGGKLPDIPATAPIDRPRNVRLLATGDHLWILASGHNLRHWNGTRWLETPLRIVMFYGVLSTPAGAWASVRANGRYQLLWLANGSSKPRLFPSTQPPVVGYRESFIHNANGWVRVSQRGIIPARKVKSVTDDANPKYRLLAGVGENLLFSGDNGVFRQTKAGKMVPIKGRLVSPFWGDLAFHSATRDGFIVETGGKDFLAVVSSNGDVKYRPLGSSLSRRRQTFLTTGDGDILYLAWEASATKATGWRYDVAKNLLHVVKNLPVPDSPEAVAVVGDQLYVSSQGVFTRHALPAGLRRSKAAMESHISKS